MNESIHNLIQSLTIEEKARLSTGRDFWHLHGIDRLNLPAIMVTDGPHGLRKQKGASDHVGLSDSVPATCFPTASGLAATWNVHLIEQVGQALGQECLAEQVSVLLGPGANLKRHPLGGRNFEYFSEDPHLTGTIAAAWIKGVQSLNIGVSLKHYALNNHERGRMVVDVVADERTVRELYLPAFEHCVRETQPWTIMCAYNKFRGVYLSEHEYLLKTILRDEWGFTGVVVTDWGANHKRVDGIKNGQSLEMPGSGERNPQKILSAIDEGSLTEEQLNESVRPVVELITKSAEAIDQGATVDLDANHDLARSVAAEGTVLLKNANDLLPLDKSTRVLVIGGLASATRYQGSGSSQITPTRLEQPLEEIRRLASNPEQVEFAEGYALSDRDDPALRAEALDKALTADRIIVIAGLTPDYESEGFDRTHLRLPHNQLQLIETLEPVHEKTVVVLQNGAPVELPFRSSVSAIIEAYLGGQAGASALAQIIYGEVNPSGKLAESFPVAMSDVPSDQWFPGDYRQSQYREGIWVGYRYFDTTATAVAYPFGHGLSYTTFDYSDLAISTPGETFDEDSTLTVTFTVTNTGSRAGAEIAQVYVGQQSPSVPRPDNELKGYTKVFLEPGESQRIDINLDYRAFAFWSIDKMGWVAESDTYHIRVAASVADIRLGEDIQLRTDHAIGQRNPALSAYFNPNTLDFDDASFSSLLTHPIPQATPTTPFQLNSTLEEIRENWLGRIIHDAALKQTTKMIGGGSPEGTELQLIQAIVANMPMRAFITMSGGKLSEGLMNRIIHIMNNDWLKAVSGQEARSE